MALITYDLIEFLAVIQNQGVNLSVGRLIKDSSVLKQSVKRMSIDDEYKINHLLRIGQLLQSAVHTFLKNENFLILLISQALHFA